MKINWQVRSLHRNLRCVPRAKAYHIPLYILHCCMVIVELSIRIIRHCPKAHWTWIPFFFFFFSKRTKNNANEMKISKAIGNFLLSQPKIFYSITWTVFDLITYNLHMFDWRKDVGLKRTWLACLNTENQPQQQHQPTAKVEREI